MAELEEWEVRYRRKVLDHINAPQGIDLSTVKIDVSQSDGYRYSSYTWADPSMEVNITWMEPVLGGADVAKYHCIDGPDEVASLLRSF